MKYQTYIPLGAAIAVTTENGIDAGPMEGFDSQAFNRILGLEALGLASSLFSRSDFDRRKIEIGTKEKFAFLKKICSSNDKCN